MLELELELLLDTELDELDVLELTLLLDAELDDFELELLLDAELEELEFDELELLLELCVVTMMLNAGNAADAFPSLTEITILR